MEERWLEKSASQAQQEVPFDPASYLSRFGEYGVSVVFYP